MKFNIKSLVLLLAMALLFGHLAFSQESEEPSLYSKTFFILKIAPHNQGYRVVYQTEAGGAEVTYVPLDWFKGQNKRAALLYLNDRAGSYMQIFWENGQFSHLRITVPPNFNAPVWGVMPSSIDAAAAFSIDDLQLHYE